MLTLNREPSEDAWAEFFDEVRGSLFHGRLSQGQVDGLKYLVTAICKHGLEIHEAAYICATALHETAHTMDLGIKEYGRGRGRYYGKPDPETGETYYGRSAVQLTHKRNYQRMGDKLGHDFVHHPDLVCKPAISAEVIISGMVDGDFTGKKLADYLHGNRYDYRHARRIVNGMDRADLIAAYAEAFETALVAMQRADA